MMMPASTALSPYSPASTPSMHPGMPQLDAAYAAAAAANLQPPAKDTTWTKLFVGGLPYTTTDQELREFFEEFGEIEEAAVIIDRQTGKSKGYGFVTMADTKAAARAVTNPNPVIQGRKSNVNYAFIGAKTTYPPTRGTAVQTTTDESGFYALMASDAYTNAAAASMRYQAYLAPQFGAAAAAAASNAAGAAMMYSPSPYGTMVQPTAVPVPTAAAQQHQHLIAGAYPTASAYEYGLAAVQSNASSAAAAAAAIQPQYFYPQMVDPTSQYMAMAGIQGGHGMTSGGPGATAAQMIPSMYSSIAPTAAAAVSAAVTSATAALPAPSAPTLQAASYPPAIQEQR